MNSKEIRQSFLDFFASKAHRIVPSAPVVPYDDPTLLFTNAGMNQFKDVFLGIGKRDYVRAADTQKCIRVSGKHNDLEEVGKDTYHHTFFEMLGNWSFGDYYKPEAILWAWELLTEVWRLDPKRLFATVYRSDDEAYDFWKRFLPEDRIQRFDEKDNFWEMGETGPCGPCSEVHYDMTSDFSGANLVNAGTPSVIEIWNLVFIQYNRRPDGTLEPLASTHVDTGMGFERICAILQGKNSNYDTDVFMPIISEISKISGRQYSSELISNGDNAVNSDSMAMRVITDHVRTLSFAISDGALPGNEGRGYVLRRILRRASRYARNLGFTEPVIYRLLPVLIEVMGEQFPELILQKETIQRIIKAEEESFLQTLDRGLLRFEDIKKNLSYVGKTIIPGADIFQLYDTFGFPPDLTRLLAEENGLLVDEDGFNQCMKEQKERSRAARKVQSKEAETSDIDVKSVFLGYDTTISEANIIYCKENRLVLDKTPFYAESGGQVADTGEIIIAGEKYIVEDVRKSGDAIVHFLDREPENVVNAVALAKVDDTRRKKIMRNHSVTHLAHEALRRVLGNHVQQAGSLVAPDYMRFDFNHFSKVNSEEIRRLEKMVNDKILANLPVQTEVLKLDEARKNKNIKMFFGDKYGDEVRVVTMGNDFSQELCGGTHVKRTSEIGLFKIVSESSIAAGIRRIEAVTGQGVENYINTLSDKLTDAHKEKEDLQDKLHQLEKEIVALKLKELSASYSEWITNAKTINGVRIVAKQVEAENLDQLRDMAEELRNSLSKKGIGLLAAIINEKAQLACVVTDDLKQKLPAGKIVGAAAKILGGGGGGKPHLATAGGKDVNKLPELIDGFSLIVAEIVGN